MSAVEDCYRNTSKSPSIPLQEDYKLSKNLKVLLPSLLTSFWLSQNDRNINPKYVTTYRLKKIFFVIQIAVN